MRNLARENSGLCVITTRESVTDLIDEKLSRLVIHTDLEQVSRIAGRALLRVKKVKGSDDELEQAVGQFGHHAFAINLLATYLNEFEGGQIAGADGIPEIDIPEEQGKHPRRLIDAFANRFDGMAEIELLRVLGLFDRPISKGERNAVLAQPPIFGLTDQLATMTTAKLAEVLMTLRRLGLIASESHHDPDEIDAHPLVREHFTEQLVERFPEAAKEAHRRLYEHLKQSAPELPDTLQDMMPLYHAVAHGCKACKHLEVLEQVYVSRICRGNEFFNINVLSAHSTDLATLSHFFDVPWKQLNQNLDNSNKLRVLNHTGFRLRSLGRLKEARILFTNALALEKEENKWNLASSDAINLCQLSLSLGELADAVSFGIEALLTADISSDLTCRVFSRTSLGQAFHWVGRYSNARSSFLEAEHLHVGQDDEPQILWSTGGFKFGELLIDLGKPEEAKRRALVALKFAEKTLWPLSTGLGHLAVALAVLSERSKESSNEDKEVTLYFEKGLSHLRRAAYVEYLAVGLLACTALRRLRGQLSDAEHDLAEAESIAERGSMLIFQIDAAIERCRLHLAMGERTAAQESLERAKDLIKQTEKPYQPHEADWPDWEPPSYVNVFKPGEIVGYRRRNPEIVELENILSGTK